MMVEQSLTTIALFGWLFIKWMRDGDERQALEELAATRGVSLDSQRAARAVAAGRGEDLRRRLMTGQLD
jgi:putative membrane protein